MRRTSHVDRVLRQYLLGELPDDVRLELEEQLIADPDTFEALGAVEDELIEEYLDRSLSPQQRRRFEHRSPDVATHQRLASFFGALKEQAAAEERERRAARRRNLLGWWPTLEWRPVAVAAVVVAAVSVVLNVWLGVRQASLQDAAGQARARLELERSDRQRVDRQLGQIAAQNRDLAVRLQEEQHQRSDLEARLNGAERLARRASAVPPTLALGLGLVRGEGALPRVAVPRGTAVVRLRLQLPAPHRSQYRATLRDANGDELWRGSKLRPERDAGGVLLVVLPGTVLSLGDYQIELGATDGGGEPEPVATFVFRVTDR